MDRLLGHRVHRSPPGWPVIDSCINYRKRVPASSESPPVIECFDTRHYYQLSETLSASLTWPRPVLPVFGGCVMCLWWLGYAFKMNQICGKMTYKKSKHRANTRRHPHWFPNLKELIYRFYRRPYSKDRGHKKNSFTAACPKASKKQRHIATMVKINMPVQGYGSLVYGLNGYRVMCTPLGRCCLLSVGPPLHFLRSHSYHSQVSRVY